MRGFTDANNQIRVVVKRTTYSVFLVLLRTRWCGNGQFCAGTARLNARLSDYAYGAARHSRSQPQDLRRLREIAAFHREAAAGPTFYIEKNRSGR